MNYFADFYITMFTKVSLQLGRVAFWWELFPQIILPFLILFSLPILLVFMFSKFNPEVQIISPLNMQLVSLAWFIVILYRQSTLEFGSILLVVVYAAVGGVVQETITIKLVGVKAAKNEILTASFMVKTDVNHLKTLLQTKKFRERLNLRRKAIEIDNGVMFRGSNVQEYETLISITKEKEDNESFVDIAVFARDKYALKMTEELEEYAVHSQFEYFKNILVRPEVGIHFKELPQSHAEPLQYLIMDELQGRVARFQQMPRGTWVKVLGVFCGLGACGIGFWQGWLALDTTLAILIPTVIYAIFEFPMKRGEGR